MTISRQTFLSDIVFPTLGQFYQLFSNMGCLEKLLSALQGNFEEPYQQWQLQHLDDGVVGRGSRADEEIRDDW